MFWWIAVAYVILGAAVAGVCMGISKGKSGDVSLPRFLFFLALWPILLLMFVIAALVGRKADRQSTDR